MKKIMFVLIVALIPIGVSAQVSPRPCTDCPVTPLPTQNVFDGPARYENTTGANESLRQALERLKSAYRFNYDFVDGIDTGTLDNLKFRPSARYPDTGTAPLREVLTQMLNKAEYRPANFEGNLVMINGPRREVRPERVRTDTLYAENRDVRDVENRGVGSTPVRVNYDDDRINSRPRGDEYIGGGIGQRNAAITRAVIGTGVGYGGYYGGYYDGYRTPVEFARDVRRYDIENVKAAFKIDSNSERLLQNVEVYVNGCYVGIASKLNNAWNGKIPVAAGRRHILEFVHRPTNAAFSRTINPESMAAFNTASHDEWFIEVRVVEDLFKASDAYAYDAKNLACQP